MSTAIQSSSHTFPNTITGVFTNPTFQKVGFVALQVLGALFLALGILGAFEVIPLPVAAWASLCAAGLALGGIALYSLRKVCGQDQSEISESSEESVLISENSSSTEISSSSQMGEAPPLESSSSEIQLSSEPSVTDATLEQKLPVLRFIRAIPQLRSLLEKKHIVSIEVREEEFRIALKCMVSLRLKNEDILHLDKEVSGFIAQDNLEKLKGLEWQQKNGLRRAPTRMRLTIENEQPSCLVLFFNNRMRVFFKGDSIFQES